MRCETTSRGRRRSGCRRGAALHALASLRAGLAGARGEVDALAARPAAARATWQVQAAQDRMFAAADDLAALTGVVMAGTAMRHPDTAGALVLARLLGDLREYTGRLGALFVAPLVRMRRSTTTGWRASSRCAGASCSSAH